MRFLRFGTDINSSRLSRRSFAKLLPLAILILLLLLPFARIEAGVADSSETSMIAELLRDRDGDGRLDRMGETVTVSGRATVGTKVLSDKYMILYMQDNSAGIMVFSKTMDTTVERGDSLRVTGTLTLHSSKPEIIVERLEVVKENNQIPDPVALKQAFNDPGKHRGMLVSGEAIVGSGDFGENQKMLKITPANSSDDSLHVFVSRSNANYEDFNFDVLEAGDRIHIRGILIRYTSDYTGKTFYQVLPRKQADFIISDLQPMMENGSFIYADIDISSGQIYVLLESGLWGYDLAEDSWQFLDAFENFEEPFSNYEFGFNPLSDKIQLWSRGIGKLYSIDPESYTIKRIDDSFDHKNQFGHFPFYRDSTLYAFGGYGFWEGHNIMVHFNRVLDEWSIQNVDSSSPFPSRRIPSTGVYDSGRDLLYVFGGQGARSSHPDDQNAMDQRFQDIWRFSFEKQKWNKVMTLDQPGKTSAGTSLSSGIGKTNKQSSSFYVPDEQMWFIPTLNPQSPEGTPHLKPVNLSSQSAKTAIKPDFAPYNEFIPSNYFYNRDTKEVVFVGVDNLANAATYPVRVIRMPVESFLDRSDDTPFYASVPFYYYLVGLALMGGLLFLFYRKEVAGDEVEKEEFDSPRLQGVIRADWFNEQEKRLLKHMYEQAQFMDTHEIEELLWSDVESYDYRRRLRNDTINSINKKFEKHYPGHDRLILRKKDPADNRRYLFGLNDNFSKE